MKFSLFSRYLPALLALPLTLSLALVSPAAKPLGGPILPAPDKTLTAPEKDKPEKLAQAPGLLGGASAATPGLLGGAADNLKSVTPVGGAEAGLADENHPSENAPPADLSGVRRLKVGGVDVLETPMPVGNPKAPIELLAPIGKQLERIGVSVSRAALENLPGNAQTPTDDVYFQINRPGDAVPIVLAVGKSVAYVNKVEQPLKAPPAVIRDKVTREDKLWLPIFSLAPLIGAAPRLAPDGTLHLNPTVQSVEIFLVKGVPVLTVKTSAPLPDGGPLNGGPKIGKIDDPDRIYIDFPGYALGLDAANTPTARAVAPGAGGVVQVRAGMVQQFPDTARVTLDLKGSMQHMVQTMPDRTIFALVVYDPTQNPDVAPPPPQNLNVSLRGLTIVVDAGHGGHDNGAPGRSSTEKNHALDIAQRLRKELDNRGATVLMTRDGDYFVTLQGRVDFANSRQADLFISCHIDSYASTSTGTTTYYTSTASQPFAREVQNELAKASGLKSKGIIQRRLFVTRNTVMPSILTESCYISNPREEKLLRDPNFRQRLALGMAQGIANYVARYGVRR